ncbi:MAG: hypothetical protein ACRDH5_18875, partial [bacterium]
RRDHSGGAGALVQRLARRIGYTPATMSQKLWGPQRLNLQVVEVIHECRRGAQDELLYRWLKPILDAYSSTEAPPLVPATWNLEQEADAHEDIAELAYTLEPTDVNLDRLIRALDRQVLRSTALRDALVVEQQRRRSHGA